MTAKVFIDGEVGTTGLQIRARLAARDDITLISLSEDSRKSRLARLGAFAEADVAILCLPDAAVHDHRARPRPSALSRDRRLHRAPDRSDVGIRLCRTGRRRAGPDRGGAKYVSNPGCYSTGAIALLKPVLEAGIIAPPTTR